MTHEHFNRLISMLGIIIENNTKAMEALTKVLSSGSLVDEKLNKKLAELRNSIESAIKRSERIIMAGQADVAQQVRDATAKLTSAVGKDIDDLVEKIRVLTEAVGNQDNVSPDLKAAADELTTAVEALDAKYTGEPPTQSRR